MRNNNHYFSKLLISSLLIFFSQFMYVANSAAAENVLQQELQKSENGRLMIGQSDIAALDMIKNLYQYNDYRLYWNKQSMVDVLLQAIRNSKTLGLNPDDYHLQTLTARLQKGFLDNVMGLSDSEQAQLDILLTDALLRLGYHLNFGKVVPGTLDPDWNLRREFLSSDPVAKLSYTMGAEDRLSRFLEQSGDRGVIYEGLIDALKKYRSIAKHGGWQVVPAGEVLKPGMRDPRVPLIAARLQATGDLAGDAIVMDELYSKQLEDAVRQFQYRHNLDVDGVIGKGTLEQMNIPVAQRIKQILVNLERIRWVRRNLGDEFVMVNIAGFKVYYVRDNKLVWKSLAQVGKYYRKTPVFRDDISYLVFNPTWTVPPTILRKDILPKLKKDPGYLKKKNMNVVDAKGKIIDASKIDWSTMTAGKFRYMIRQEPGPQNALGRVKIMFPNKHLVYLHDTPSKSKFKRTERAFSSGCIRIENPFELVELLLKDSDQWNQSRFDEILSGGKLQNVSLPEKVPVLLLYFTVHKDENGSIMFYRDIYKRDTKVIDELNKPFKLVLPQQKSA